MSAGSELKGKSEEQMIEVATARETLRQWMHDNGFAAAWAGGDHAIFDLRHNLFWNFEDEKAATLDALHQRYQRARRGRLSH